MQPIHQLLSTQYPKNDYLLLFRPTENVIGRLTRIQQQWKQNYNVPSVALKNCHIILAQFSQFAIRERRMLDVVQQTAMEACPFMLDFNGFVATPTHSIGIGIPQPKGIVSIVKKLKEHSKTLNCTGIQPYFGMQPDMKLATKLAPQVFADIWQQYGTKHFKARCIANSILLLRKQAGAARWHIMESFALQNLQVTPTQGVLFV